MTAIKVEILIKNVQEWNVDWGDEKSSNNALSELQADLIHKMVYDLGIRYENINIEKCELEKQKEETI